MAEQLADTQSLESTTININRTASVVKGGRRFSFSALVVVGDRRGKVGVGYGKAPGVPAAIEKAQKDARKSLVNITLQGGTLPHPVTGRFASSKVRLLPAAPGTGVIAGGTVRAVLEMAGVKDCLTKAYGSTKQINLCRAAMEGLQGLRSKAEIAKLRGVEMGKTEVDEKLEQGVAFVAETVSPAEAQASDQGAKGGKPAAETTQAREVQPEKQVEHEAPKPEQAAAVDETEASEDVDTPKESVSGDAEAGQPESEAPTGGEESDEEKA